MYKIVQLDGLEYRPLNDGMGHVEGRYCEVFTKTTAETEALRLLVQEYPPGGYTEGHPIHEDFEQAYYVLAGTMTVILEGQPFEAGAGTLVFIPRGTKHEHRNDGSEPMTFLTINVPVRSGEVPPLGDVPRVHPA
jgi:quercetin dioxygenase-like cupin family protein